jgi:acyl carrier protein
MIARGQLLEQVVRVLRGPCGVAHEIAEGSRLAEDLQLDSVGLLALAVSLENHYKIRLDDDPRQPPETVADVLDLLEKNLGLAGTEGET